MELRCSSSTRITRTLRSSKSTEAKTSTLVKSKSLRSLRLLRSVKAHWILQICCKWSYSDRVYIDPQDSHKKIIMQLISSESIDAFFAHSATFNGISYLWRSSFMHFLTCIERSISFTKSKSPSEPRMI